MTLRFSIVYVCTPVHKEGGKQLLQGYRGRGHGLKAEAVPVLKAISVILAEMMNLL